MGDETSPERWQKCPCGTSVNVIAPEIIKATVARCGKCGHSFKAGSVEVDELVSALEEMLKVAEDLSVNGGSLGDDYPEYHRARSLLTRLKGERP